MKTLSVDLRKRILDSYDVHEGTRLDMALRYKVSLGPGEDAPPAAQEDWDIAPRHRFSDAGLEGMIQIIGIIPK